MPPTSVTTSPLRLRYETLRRLLATRRALRPKWVPVTRCIRNLLARLLRPSAPELERNSLRHTRITAVVWPVSDSARACERQTNFQYRSRMRKQRDPSSLGHVPKSQLPLPAAYPYLREKPPVGRLSFRPPGAFAHLTYARRPPRAQIPTPSPSPPTQECITNQCAAQSPVGPQRPASTPHECKEVNRVVP